MQSIDQVSSQALRQDTQIYLSLYDADPDGQAVRQVEKVVAELSPASTVKPVDEWVDSGVDQVNNAVGVIYALLAFAILLSLFGIVNTLSLSMVERTNEIGLLRAVGLTRRQLIGQVVTEGALIAAFGAIIGVGIGLWIGAGLISITKDTTAIGLDVPWLTLLGLVVGAGLAGLLAAIVPAVRVGRLPIAEAIGR
jgi:putative ABC transport system permease protein